MTSRSSTGASERLTRDSGYRIEDFPQTPLPYDDTKDAFDEGKRLFDEGKLDDAEITLRQAVRLDAKNTTAIVLLARTLLGNARYERAGTIPVVRSLLAHAIVVDPACVDAKALLDELRREFPT